MCSQLSNKNLENFIFINKKKFTLVKEIFSVDWFKLILLLLLLLRIVTKVDGPTAKIFLFFSSWVPPIVAVGMS